MQKRDMFKKSDFTGKGKPFILSNILAQWELRYKLVLDFMRFFKYLKVYLRQKLRQTQTN